MKRFSLLLGTTGGILLLGLIAHQGLDWLRSEDQGPRSRSSEEYHYRQATVTPYSAFMRLE